MLTYEQSTGRLLKDSPVGTHLMATGYSGRPEAKNNPLAQHQHDVGPIPQGAYWIGEARDTAEHGPEVLPLSPVPGTQTYGRSGFLIHGDSIKDPGTASHGCIILNHETRMRIALSGETLLVVVSGLQAVGSA